MDKKKLKKKLMLCVFIYCCPEMLLVNCNSFPLFMTRRLEFKGKQLFGSRQNNQGCKLPCYVSQCCVTT